MQPLGNLLVNGTSFQPALVVLALDSSGVPQFAMIQESPTDIPVVRYGNYTVETRGILDDFQCESTKAQNGGGLIRRSASLSILTEHAKGYPFFKAPLKKSFYYGGQSVEDVYFSIYAIDRSKQNEDIRLGVFFGHFRIESGVKWTESNGTTAIPLVDIFLQDRTKIGATGEDIPEQFFIFNPWYGGEIIPKVWGYVPRVRMLNVFPSISTKDIAGSISGRVESNYTNASATIVIEKYADQASVLRQLASLGYYVRIRFADNEVMRGTLSYNSGTGEVTFTIADRNTYYAKAKGYTFAGSGQTPEVWNSDASHQRIPQSWSNTASVIINGKEIIQDANGWMQATLEFFNSGVSGKADIVEVATQLEGWDNEADGVIKHQEFLYDGNASTLSYDFSDTQYGVVQTGIGPVHTWTWIAGEYLKFKNTAVEVKLYFRDPATAAGSGSIGDGWSIVGVEPNGAVDYSCFIRNGHSRFLNNNVYAEGDGRLIKIPTGNIVSVTDSTTAYGLSNMAKITLTAAPIDMDIGATSNVVYTDALYKTDTYDNRTETILSKILDEAPLLKALVGTTVSSPSGDNWMPYVGVLARTPEQLVAVIDRLLYQAGATLVCRAGLYEISKAGLDHSTELEVVDGDTYIYPLIRHTDENELIEDSCSIEYGDLISTVDSNGYEYIPLYYDIEYGGWEDPFYKKVTPLVNTAIRSKDHKFSYKFNYINDPASANYAVSCSLSIGHPSGLSCVERYLNADMTIKGIRWEAMDPIVFRDFPMISTADETNAVLDDDRHPMYLKPSDGKKFIMGAVCVIDNITYKFPLKEPVMVSVRAKMSQTFVNANGINIYKPPYPPNPPPVPPGNPDTPPNPTGGSTSEFPFGIGSYSPMDPIVSIIPPSVTIDSLDDETVTVSVDIDGDWIYNGGWTYSLQIKSADGTSYPEDSEGAYFSSGGNGEFVDKTNDLYDPAAQNHTLNINYKWFQGGPISSQRNMIIRLARLIKYNATSTLYYIEFNDYHLSVYLQDLRDIVAS